MPKSTNQKRKILYLMQILLEQTDEDHFLSLSQLTALLAQRGIEAERKSLYDDLEQLRQFGIDKRKRGRLSCAEPDFSAGGAEAAGRQCAGF